MSRRLMRVAPVLTLAILAAAPAASAQAPRDSGLAILKQQLGVICSETDWIRPGPTCPRLERELVDVATALGGWGRQNAFAVLDVLARTMRDALPSPEPDFAVGSAAQPGRNTWSTARRNVGGSIAGNR